MKKFFSELSMDNSYLYVVALKHTYAYAEHNVWRLFLFMALNLFLCFPAWAHDSKSREAARKDDNSVVYGSLEDEKSGDDHHSQRDHGHRDHGSRQCSTPIEVEQTDYFLDVTSTLPHYQGLPAQLELRKVAPVYNSHCRSRPHRAVILLHGRTIDVISGLDLQFQDYSVQEAMAREGLITYSFNRLGTGLSSRFAEDDPCNASIASQQQFLIPNPLSQTCPNPDPFHMTNSDSWQSELDAVVNYVRNDLDIKKVSLFAWSRGGVVAGPYASTNPDKIKRVVFLASTYNTAVSPPAVLPVPGPSLELNDRAGAESAWLTQTSNMECPGQVDPAILDPIWESMMAHDALGRTWGTDGILRISSQDQWGWYTAVAQAVTVPTMTISGLRDTTVPTATMMQLHNDLGSTNKVLVKIDCASHFSVWESSSSPTWPGGPHVAVQNAAIEWLRHETYQGSAAGTFQVNSNGTIDGPF